MTNMKFPADLVTFTDVILIEKFLFCAPYVICRIYF